MMPLHRSVPILLSLLAVVFTGCNRTRMPGQTPQPAAHPVHTRADIHTDPNSAGPGTTLDGRYEPVEITMERQTGATEELPDLVGFQSLSDGTRVEVVTYVHTYVERVETYPRVWWAGHWYYNVHGNFIFWSDHQYGWCMYWGPPVPLVHVWNHHYPWIAYSWGVGYYGPGWYWGGVDTYGFHAHGVAPPYYQRPVHPGRPHPGGSLGNAKKFATVRPEQKHPGPTNAKFVPKVGASPKLSVPAAKGPHSATATLRPIPSPQSKPSRVGKAGFRPVDSTQASGASNRPVRPAGGRPHMSNLAKKQTKKPAKATFAPPGPQSASAKGQRSPRTRPTYDPAPNRPGKTSSKAPSKMPRHRSPKAGSRQPNTPHPRSSSKRARPKSRPATRPPRSSPTKRDTQPTSRPSRSPSRAPRARSTNSRRPSPSPRSSRPSRSSKPNRRRP